MGKKGIEKWHSLIEKQAYFGAVTWKTAPD
jgi:hypothetical protein